ncbi:unnamed protein product [Gongylonema pulchrum]|uniref:KIX domain-containing protein n=1 Tax=Gongylonema pulchrum TaxID=637853 RepID=A0A183EWW6_9BILA|nr:unnamed protein product [Gongylonema pulchrum]VDN44227.1 unnamed protein product [Gongylonema pulchrum]
MSPASNDTIDTTELFLPETPRIVKPWQEEVTTDFRSQIIAEYVKKDCPVIDSTKLAEIKIFARQAREMERAMFEHANDRVWAFCVSHCCSSLITALSCRSEQKSAK